MKLFFVAAEASGDAFAADVIRVLQANTSDAQCTIEGVGGDAMARLGVHSPIDISPLSVLGFIEGLRAYGDVVRIADETAQLIIQSQPDAVILVDSWGFMLRVAQRVRKLAPKIRLIKLIGPQVWATRAGRAKTLAATVDHLLCIHDFEVPYYEPFGLDVTVIGNPALSRTTKGDRDGFRSKYGVTTDEQLILVLPGSRRSEADRVAPDLFEAARQLSQNGPNRRVACVLSPNIAEQLRSMSGLWPKDMIVSDNPDEKFDAMAAADVGLVCSGTVTTEAAIQGLPMVIGYRLNFLTWIAARYFLYKAPHITLFNVAADKEVAKELVQKDLNPENLVREAERLLTNADIRQEQVNEQYDALKAMGLDNPPAAKLAADVIVGLAQQRAA